MLRLDRRLELLGGFRLSRSQRGGERVPARHEHVDRRDDEQGEGGPDDHAGDEHDADAVARSRAGTGGEHQGQVADDGGRGRHQDGAQARAGRLDDGVQRELPLLLQLVGELDNQDAVLRDEPDQGDETDLAVDVQRRQAEEREEQGPGQGERHGAGQDDERIPEALELGREDQVDQDGREDEDAEELAALRAELPRLPRVIDAVSRRKEALGLLLEETERLIERHVRRYSALDAHSIELLEPLELTGLGARPERREGRQRDRPALGTRDVDVLELIGRETFRALHLRDDLVAAPLDAEAIDIVAAEERGQVRPGLAHVDTQRTHLVAVEDDLRLRLIELDVGVRVHEEAARVRLPDQLAGQLGDLRRLARGADDELDRKALAARQRRRRQGNHAHSRKLRERRGGLHLKLLGGLFPLAPGLENHAAESTAGRCDLKRDVALRERPEHFAHLGREKHRLFERGVGGGLDEDRKSVV